MDDDLHGQVEIASVVQFYTFLNDAGVNGVNASLNLATEGDFKFQIDVFIRSKIDSDKIAVAAVGNGVVPRSVFGVVFTVLLHISWIHDFPCC